MSATIQAGTFSVPTFTPATLEECLALIDETVAAYTIHTRCIGPKGTCQYSPTDKSPGCAIGRLIKDKSLCDTFDHWKCGTEDPKSVAVNIVAEYLPPEVARYGTPLLGALQSLHDFSSHWEENGLSEEGKEIVETIRQDVRRRFAEGGVR